MQDEKKELEPGADAPAGITEPTTPDAAGQASETPAETPASTPVTEDEVQLVEPEAATEPFAPEVSTPDIEPPAMRMLATGTVIEFGGAKFKLASPTVIEFGRTEDAFVGLCLLSDNFEVNRSNFKFRYDGLGTVLPLAEQVDDEADLPRFIASLDEIEAARFGIDSNTLVDYKNPTNTKSTEPEAATV